MFDLARTDPARLPAAATIGIAAAALLAGWGVFIYLNTRAEELEPEAMERTKREDQAVEQILSGASAPAGSFRFRARLFPIPHRSYVEVHEIVPGII